ncbi:uncharacterized protein LOC143988806 [Lithobates pipiens]
MWVSQCSAALHKGEDTSPKDQRQPSIMSSMKIMLCMALIAAVAVVKASDPGKFSSCCTKVSSAKPKVHLVDFLRQKADPPCVEAVMFIGEDGSIRCSKPNLPWVIQKMKEIIHSKEALRNESNA